MDITREQARQIFMAGAMWEQEATDQNFNDIWDVLSRKMQESKSKESGSLQPVSEVDIVDSDIATIEALHDLLLDAHGYSLEFITLKRARELTAKMYKAFK